MKNGHAVSNDATPDDWLPPTNPVSNPVEAVEGMLRKYCVLPKHAYLPVSLWVVATYLSSVFRAIPYIALLSPVKRCGKSRLLEVLHLLCFEPFSAIAPSPASLFRSIDKAQTLLLDEMEMLKPSKNASETQQALIAILNAGYKRGATVPRCETIGKQIVVVHWPVYGPKAFATTMRLPSTLIDRCIVLSMQRRTPDQEISRFRQARADREGKDITAQITGWVDSFKEVVTSLYESLPDLEFLNDRDSEIWSATDTKFMQTTELLIALQQMEDSPWKTDFPLTARKLARLLKPFGILPAQRAIARYLPSPREQSVAPVTDPADA